MADPEDFDGLPIAFGAMALFIIAVVWALSFSMTVPPLIAN